MQGKLCLVTGATSGLGKVTARVLAEKGAHVVAVARDAAKGASTVDEIIQQTGNPAVDLLLADLSSQAAITTLADEFKRRYDKLDVLINNAGGMFIKRQESVDGIEMTWAVNHLSYFLLTLLLLDPLQRSPSARIVNVASRAHKWRDINLGDVEHKTSYSALAAYQRSKLANVLFTYELARRLADRHVTVNTLHPGVVRTNIGGNNGWVADLIRTLAYFIAVDVETGAQTQIYLASSPEVEGLTGKYFADGRPIPSSEASYDLQSARKLWDISLQMTGLVDPVPLT